MQIYYYKNSKNIGDKSIMKKIKYKDFEAKIIIGPIPKYGRNSYYLEKLTEDWLSNDDLINLCDGKKPGDYNFGGVVTKMGNNATVDVYID